MISLSQILRESILDTLFGRKKQTQQPTTKSTTVQAPKESNYTEQGMPITIEGIHSGYSVYRGSDPVGDLRSVPEVQSAEIGKEGYGEKVRNGITYVYYYIGGLKDAFGRRGAYLSVSTRKDKADHQKLKAIAKGLEKRAIRDQQIVPHNL